MHDRKDVLIYLQPVTCCRAGLEEAAQAVMGRERGVLGASPAEGGKGEVPSSSSSGIPGLWPLTLPPLLGCGICGCPAGGGRLAMHFTTTHASASCQTPCVVTKTLLARYSICVQQKVAV